MKKQLLTILIACAISWFAAAQNIEPGTYEGAGKMQGMSCPVKFRFEQSGVVVNYEGICNCVALLQQTETSLLFQEKDFLSADGGIRSDACRSKEYVFFTKKGADLTANWGETPAEALANLSPAMLLKIK